MKPRKKTSEGSEEETNLEKKQIKGKIESQAPKEKTSGWGDQETNRRKIKW
jgi:hypothetical protein